MENFNTGFYGKLSNDEASLDPHKLFKLACLCQVCLNEAVGHLVLGARMYTEVSSQT
jgi:hypothetical protein